MLNFEDIKKEYESLLEKLGNPELISNWGKSDESKDSSSPFAGAQIFEELIKRKTFLEKIIEKNNEINELKTRIEENKTIISAREDLDLVSLAETEISEFNEKKENLEKELNSLLEEEKNLESEEDKSSSFIAKTRESKSVIVEIRAGTGGGEAALFAADLFRMYSKFSQSKEWKQKVLDSKPTELGGLKEITFELNGKNVWALMEYEAGVHRVQRIPSTEKSGRIHTSTASVAVLPKPKKGKIEIRNSDLKIDTYKASGPGGQYVNKRMTAIRITHLPTNIVVNSQNERSLQQNKENALSILEAKILKKKIEEEERKLKNERKTQIGKAERAEKVRTYNFPQNRITDHRIKKNFHNLEQIMEGRLDPIIKALSKSE